MKPQLTILFLLCFGFLANAQIPPPTCIDTTLIQVGPPCTTVNYNPVCGCDSTTYHNGCFAYYNGVINYSNGICEPVDYFFYPNPTAEILYLDLITRYDTDVNFYITDINGNVQFFKIYSGLANTIFELTINVSSFKRGVYIIVAETQGYFEIQKFVKFNPY